jgi:hypothetical protein
MLEFLIISAAVGWALFALYSPVFNHLDNIENDNLRNRKH